MMTVRRTQQMAWPDWLIWVWLLIVLSSHLTTSELVPSFIEEPRSVVVKGHERVVLRCKVTPSSASIRWLHKGQILDHNPSAGILIDEASIEIQSFRKNRHEGLYFCVARTSVGQIRSSPALLSAPSLGEFTSGADVYVNVTAGNTAVLPCHPPKSNPKAQITFTFNNGPMKEDERHKVLPSGNLHIASVSGADQGIYRCVAVNSVSGQRREADYLIHLSVQDTGVPIPAALQSGETNLTVAAGSDAMFECIASGNPPPSVQWNRYGGVISNRSQKILGNLLIRNVDVRDAGTYICSVNPSDQLVRKIFTLDVQVPPVVHISNPNMVKEEGQSVTIECQVRSLYKEAKPTIKWFHNSAELDPAVVEGARVNIPQLVLSDGGLYQCVAIGKTGMVSAVARLDVRPTVNGRVQTDQGGQPGNSSTDKSKSRGWKKRKGTNGNRHKRKKKHRNKKKLKKKRKGKKGGTNVREGPVNMVPPSKPDVSKVDDSSVLVNWTVPANDGLPITFFRVQFKELKPNKGNWNTIEEDIPKKKWKYHVRGLKPGHTYKFRITAVYTNQDNRFGLNSKRFTLEKGNSVPHSRPVIAEVTPYNFDNKYSLKVTWQYTSNDGIPVSGFYLEYSPYKTDIPDKEYIRIPLPEPAVRNYLIKNLKPATDYTIRIKGFNEAGDGEYSFPAVKATLGKDIRDQFPTIGRTTPAPEANKAANKVANKTTVPTGTPNVVMVKQTTPYYKPRNNTESSSEMLYMVLGIVLGILMLALIVFMVMCGIKQRQQRPMMDSMGKKYMNGGFALNGINGAVPNGHTHYCNEDRQKMNISVNPLSDMELAQRADNSSMQQAGLPASPAVSDNNFNSIRSSNKNVALPNGGTGCLDSSDPSRYMGGNSGADDDEQISSVSGSNESQSSTSSLPDYRHCLALHSNPDNPPHCCSCSHSRLNQSRPEQSLQSSTNQHRPTSGSSSSGGHHHHHRRRRKHRSCQEHSTRDQATNTDLSSNEGTMDSSSIPELTKDRPRSSEGTGDGGEGRDVREPVTEEGDSPSPTPSPSPRVEVRGTSPSHHHIDNSHDT